MKQFNQKKIQVAEKKDSIEEGCSSVILNEKWKPRPYIMHSNISYVGKCEGEMPQMTF